MLSCRRVIAHLAGELVAVRGMQVSLEISDRMHAIIDDSMIDRPFDADQAFDVHGLARLRGCTSAQFSNIASFYSIVRPHQGAPEAAERALRARLMWGFS